MCRDESRSGSLDAKKINKLYAAIIVSEMQRQGVTTKSLIAEKVIKSHRKCHLKERIESGELTMDEFQRLFVRLKIDPIRAGLTMVCFEDAIKYQDPCCETTAKVAAAMAAHLSSELAACEGEFSTIRKGLCDNIGKKNAEAIAEHHRSIEKRHNGEGFQHAFG